MHESGEHLGLSASLEDYLETIYLLVSKYKSARVRDISSRLGVSKSSVTGALRALSSRRLINYAPYEVITLTEHGEKLARELSDSHSSIKAFLKKVLLIEEAMADETACAMEHCLPREIVERIAGFIEFCEANPDKSADLLESFRKFSQSGDAE